MHTTTLYEVYDVISLQPIPGKPFSTMTEAILHGLFLPAHVRWDVRVAKPATGNEE